MNLVAVTYIVYVVLSISITIWVANTLFRNGRLFLVDSFGGNLEIADAVNQLLRVGFYLVNVGFVSMYLRFGPKPTTGVEAIEYISVKVGVVLLVLGGMHFFNMFNFSKIRSKGLRKKNSEPDAPPSPSTVNEATAVSELAS